MSPVYQNGRWQLVNDITFEATSQHTMRSYSVVTAMHDCSVEAHQFFGSWTTSNNVQNGACHRCGEKVPEDITTIWKLLNFDRLAE